MAPRAGSAMSDVHPQVLPSILHPPMHIPWWHYALESEFSGPHLEMGSSDLFLNYCAWLPPLSWGGGLWEEVVVLETTNLEVLLHW